MARYVEQVNSLLRQQKSSQRWNSAESEFVTVLKYNMQQVISGTGSSDWAVNYKEIDQSFSAGLPLQRTPLVNVFMTLWKICLHQWFFLLLL